MTNPIVEVNAFVQSAPAPNQLQQTGAFISQGGTTLAAMQDKLLTQLSDLTSILTQPLAITSISWSGAIATVTTAANHGLPQGEVIYIAIAGAVPTDYNGVFPCTITGANTFTYELNSNPGSETTPGTWVVNSANTLLQMGTQFFNNGTQQATYVLELGAGSDAAGVLALSTFITAQPTQIFYGYLVPRSWAKEPTFITFAAGFTAVTSKTYFWTTMDLQNYLNWLTASPSKSVIGLIEAPATAVWPANVLTALSWSGADNTISSGTYNNGTGVVTLTMSASIVFGAGTPFTLSSLTGTGAYASLDGSWTALTASGTAVTFQAPAGLGATTVTGGTLTAGGMQGTLNATTTTNHGVSAGQWFQLTGCAPVGYNGYYLALEGTSGDTLLAVLPTNPGIETTLGSLIASTVASSGIGSTEFDLADPFWSTLSWNPSSANRVPPLSFVFMVGATPFPIKGNGSILATLLQSNISYVGTGAEGGLTNAILRNGRTLDGNQFNYWYSIDWTQIQCDLAISNAVINGSNTSLAPLYYDQQGINTLQGAVGNVVSTGIGAGLILGALTLTELDPTTFANNVQNGVYSGQAVVNAIPFATYVTANPANYQEGLYGGLSVAFTPQVGFQQIVINLTAVTFGGV